MALIKIKDATGAEITIDANWVFHVCKNESLNTTVRSLILFKKKGFNSCGYLFSSEEQADIVNRVKQAREEDDDCIGLTD